MTITQDGLVGIGMSSPVFALDVAGGDVRFQRTLGSTDFVLSTPGGDVRLFSQFNVPINIGTNGDAFKFTILPSGNVGIGTANPTAKLYVNGDLCATGAKNAVVPTHLGMTKVYSQESPEVWFEDFGSGRLREGEVAIELDPTFLEMVTIDDRHPLRVFVTLEDECNGVYVVPGETSFVVREQQHGRSSAPFSYRVVAKRKGFEDVRLQTAEPIATAH